MSANKSCPLCGREQTTRPQYQGSERYYQCPYCGHFGIGDVLAHQEEYNKSYHDKSHLLRGYIYQVSSRNYGAPPVFLSADDIDEALAKCPQDVAGKMKALLTNIIIAQKYFGQRLDLEWNELTYLAFAENDDEARAILDCLVEEGLVREENTLDSATVLVTGRGIREYEAGKLALPATVFISSTCYDLLDLRFELAAHLEARGSVVKLSEDPERFAVDPTGDSIQTCIANLESSDVVVCVIDRRYGGILGGTYGDISATHAEVRHALAMEPPKPVFYFLREKAWLEYGLLKGNPSLDTQWVEPKNADARAKWLAFVKEIASLPCHANRSNWMTPFRSSCDLKPLVLKRLNESHTR